MNLAITSPVSHIAGLSPSWSMVEDSCAAVTDRSGPQSPPWTSRGPATEDDDDLERSSEQDYSNLAQPPWSAAALEGLERYDEWSLADADIEQLLCQSGMGVTGAGGAMIPTPREGGLIASGAAGSGEDEDDDDPPPEAAEEGFSEVLRDLLEEEVVGSLGRLLAQTPPPSRHRGPSDRR